MALTAITMVACHHDDGETIMELHTERFGGQKLAVQDSTAAWCEGDSVWINGGAYRITIDNNGRANVYVPTAASYNAVFPASIKLGGNRVCLPAEYEYATDDSGRQIINLPMAASSDGSNGLFFKHLTGAIIVKFINNRSETVVLDRISVHSANPLCGTFEIGDENTLTPSGTTDTTVTIYFTKHEVLMAHSDTIAVLLPVAPTGGDNQFSVEVSCHVDGNRYTARNRQSSPHAFQRNMLGYAYMTVDDTFISPLALFTNQGNGATREMNIYTLSDFILMHKAINNGWQYGGYSYSGFSYIIHSDIDLSMVELTPISNFTGLVFNGNNHAICNLTINSNTENCALFETISGSTTITNIKLTNITLNSNGSTTTRRISPLIARLASPKNVSNCTTSVSSVQVSSTNDIYFGGIAASTASNVAFVSCSTDIHCTLYANNRIYYGGIVGQAEKNDTCQSCIINNKHVSLETNSGNIFAGGAIGHGKTKSRQYFIHTNCIDSIHTHTNSGTSYIGGLVGYLYRDNSGLLVYTSNLIGSISASSDGSNPIYAGKIYGYGSIKNRYNDNVWTYDASGLTIPVTGGTIISGDPTGNY